jgi:hypothetical protein
MLSAEGKSDEQLAQEAWEAWEAWEAFQQYQQAEERRETFQPVLDLATTTEMNQK